MGSDNLLITALPEVLNRAVDIAQEAANGEIGDAAEGAYLAQIERTLEKSGMTMEELDSLGGPRTWFGRMFERAQDWWWDRSNARKNEPSFELEAAFSFPVPLLQTHPLQDTPLDYDEVEKRIAVATADIISEITKKTDWELIPFKNQALATTRSLTRSSKSWVCGRRRQMKRCWFLWISLKKTLN
jgi:hypothetical protein